jgi:succinoglycan biosynthesis transport protein ExoP
LEDEIDLRAYVTILFRHKFWIAGLSLIAALTAFGVSSLMPPTYEATALVAAIKPSYLIQFDPRVQTVQTQSDLQPSYRAYPALALGDGLVAKLEGALAAELSSTPYPLAELQKKMEAQGGTDASIIELTVKDEDPERAATIVNLWAELFVESTNQLYGKSEQDLALFEGQLPEAEQVLSSAEQALIDFQALNQAGILGTQLESKRTALGQYLAGARMLRMIIEDAKSLHARLSTQDPSLRASLSDEIASLFVEIESLNSDGLPIQLQLSGQQGLSEKTVGEQATYLASLIRALEDKCVILEAEAEGLEPDILRLQQRLQEEQTREGRLSMARGIAEETYRTLTRKVAETRIAAQDTEASVRLASRAAVPSIPVAPRRLMNTLLAGALGFFVGVLGAFGVEYWRSGTPEREA